MVTKKNIRNARKIKESIRNGIENVHPLHLQNPRRMNGLKKNFQLKKHQSMIKLSVLQTIGIYFHQLFLHHQDQIEKLKEMKLNEKKEKQISMTLANVLEN